MIAVISKISGVKCLWTSCCYIIQPKMIHLFYSKHIHKYTGNCYKIPMGLYNHLTVSQCCNKRPMGHNAHPRNQFKSMNTFERSFYYIYYKIGPVVQEEKIFKIKFGWNWPSGSIEEDFYISSMYFCNHFPLEKGGALHLRNLINTSPKDDLCQVWLKFAQWFWRRRFFLKLSMHFHLEKGGVLHLNQLESPSPKYELCQVWLKLAQCFWRRRFLKFVNVFSQLSPLGKGQCPSFELTWIPFTKRWFVQSLV